MTIRAIGDAIVVTSKLTIDQVERLSKFDKEALSLYKGEGDKREEYFRVSFGAKGSIGNYGVVFDSVDSNGCLQTTALRSRNGATAEDLATQLAEETAGVLTNGNAIEAQAMLALEGIEIKIDEAKYSIEVL